MVPTLALLAGAVVGALLALAVVGRRLPGREQQQATLAQLADETERTAVLARSRDRLSQAFDALEDGVLVVDDQGEVVVRNAAAARFQDARHSDALAEDMILRLLAAALAGESSRRELSLFGPPREILLLRAEPLRAHDRIAGAIVWVRNISEARRVDEMRRDFVANVSHELRTPIGALGLLAETIAGEHEADVMQRLAERMVREADRLARIVDDLLDLSLIEMAESPARERVAVVGIIDDAVEQVRSAADAASIEISCFDLPSDVEVECDRRQLVSAVFNLLDNAVKYSDRGSRIHVGAAKDAEKVSITVRDHGVGIPSRDLERVFERFYRVDRARSRDTGGTGLGLSIVRHVANAHGGEVSVVSHEGEGSTFTLQLPIAHEPEPEQAP